MGSEYVLLSRVRQMTRPAKLGTNKRDAQRATVQKSAAGRAVARMNALFHVFRAASLVVPGEGAELCGESGKPSSRS